MDIADINGQLARMRNEQAKIGDALCELAEELSARSKRLDQKIDDATHELVQAANQMKRASLANAEGSLLAVRSEVLSWAKGID